MKHPFLKYIGERIAVFDGAMGTALEGRYLLEEDYQGRAGCPEILNITRPDVVRETHQAYLDAGCDVIETNTFGANKIKLEAFGLSDKMTEINRGAAGLARRMADERWTARAPRFVAGSMGPTGMLISSLDEKLSRISASELIDIYWGQAVPLLEGGVDLLTLETCQDILEGKCAILGAKKAMASTGTWVPLIFHVTLDPSQRMLLGTDIRAALTTIETMGIHGFGINCSTGPAEMRDSLRYLAENSFLPVSCMPNAGMPVNVDGKAVYSLEPEEMAELLIGFVKEFGVKMLGGCCGTTHKHMEMLVRAVRDIEKQDWIPAPRVDRTASALKSVDLRQEPPPLLVGERTNAAGSRKFKKLLMAEDYDGILELARDQIAGGAHVLDVNVAHNDLPRDELYYMTRLVKRFAALLESPLMIDSNDPGIHTAALEQYPGRAIINSINLEGDGSRLHSTLRAVQRWNAAVVAMTIDEEGMAHEADKKFAVADRIYQIAVNEYGISPGSLFFDPLTFPLTTGEAHLRNSAKETLQAITRIKKELPDAKTNLGVSNISFGIHLSARRVLNSVFLYHAIQAGLDMAIVNPKDITPYPEIRETERALVENLIFNRSEDALSLLVKHFEDIEKKAAPALRVPDKEWSIAQTVEEHITFRRHDRLIEDLEKALQQHSAAEIINTMLIGGMQKVGDRFGKGELILPYVLESAEVMKKAVTYLEPFLESKDAVSGAKIVLATVYGDVHDIGKNLVKTILIHNGYRIFDLGTQAPIQTIIDAAIREGADAIGLSALLVSTSRQMKHMVRELQQRNLHFPLLIGGAAVNKRFCAEISLVEGENPYPHGVFYCRDAFDGMQTINALMDEKQGREGILARYRTMLREALRPADVRSETKEGEEGGHRKETIYGLQKESIDIRYPLPEPPFRGSWIPQDMSLKDLFPLMDLDRLYRHYWKGRSSKEMDYDSLIKKVFEPERLRLQEKCESSGWIFPKSVYGYFPCRSEGDVLHVYDFSDLSRILATFSFPRQKKKELLCLADYFAPGTSEQPDVLGLLAVTAGGEVVHQLKEMNEKGEYEEAFYLQGLAMAVAEAAAKWTHGIMRKDLGLEKRQGKRYSFGFPPCPDLGDQTKLFQLLRVTHYTGITLTESNQMDPEFSVSALVVHHPAAKYFTM